MSTIGLPETFELSVWAYLTDGPPVEFARAARHAHAAALGVPSGAAAADGDRARPLWHDTC
jgi:hypothetical protein